MKTAEDYWAKFSRGDTPMTRAITEANFKAAIRAAQSDTAFQFKQISVEPETTEYVAKIRKLTSALTEYYRQWEQDKETISKLKAKISELESRIAVSSEPKIEELQKENERLRNDLLDALDLKQGNGPTALSMLKSEIERLKGTVSSEGREEQ